MSTLHDLIFDYTLRNVALGGMLLGIVAGELGQHISQEQPHRCAVQQVRCADFLVDSRLRQGH